MCKNVRRGTFKHRIVERIWNSRALGLGEGGDAQGGKNADHHGIRGNVK